MRTDLVNTAIRSDHRTAMAALSPALDEDALLLDQLMMLDQFERAGRLIGTSLDRGADPGTAEVLAIELALSHLLAVRGDQAEVWQRTDRILAFAVPHDNRLLAARSRWVRGLAALGAGAPETALHELKQGAAGHPAVAAWAVADIAESATAVGRPDIADAVRAEADPDRYGVPSRVGFRAAALTADQPDAERLFLAALRPADTAPMPFADARTRFAYGSRLARCHQMAPARSHLARARQEFEALGAEGWTRRAATALQAAGTGDASAAADRHGLTPREHQIARLAAQGLSNPEIGCRLGISARTVGVHLHNLFPKLGIVSRTQLGSLDLSDAEPRAADLG
jgi:DNA-binding CsgD family transcriptional regulator